MKTTLRLLAFLRPLTGWVGISVLLAGGTIASNIGLLGTSAYLIASAALHPSIAALEVAIVGVRFFGIARSLLRYLERLVSHSANFRLLAGLRTWFYQKLEPLAPARLTEAHHGDLLDRVVADIDGLEDFYVRAVAPQLTALLVTVGMGWYLGAIAPALGGVLVSGLALSGVGVPWLARQLGRQPGQAWVKARSQLTADLVDGVQGSADLVAFRAAAAYRKRLQSAGKAAGKAQIRQAAWGGLAKSLTSLATGLTLWGMMWLAIPMVRLGQFDGVTLAVVTLITLASFEATLPLGPAAQRLEQSHQSAKRLFAITDARAAVMDPILPAPPPRTTDLRIEGLTFRYADGLRPALAGFDLDLPAGKRVGIVGPSGSGKSTLVALLLRYWQAEAGRIWLDGKPLEKYTLADVRSVMGVIGQNPYLFNDTLRANLLLACPQATAQQLEGALRQVRLAGWVATLPKGLETWVGERGMQVSGGERQRLAAARVLLQDAPIWLLDEPTGHLDPANRRSVGEMLLQATRGRSLVWITHALDELDAMDEIIVLRDGQILERGAPDALRTSGGWFARWSRTEVI